MTETIIISDIKQQITDVYDDTKRQIESKLRIINNEIRLLKNFHDNFYKKSIEIISKLENDNNLLFNPKFALTTSDLNQFINNNTINAQIKKSKTPPKQKNYNLNDKKINNDNNNDIKKSTQNDLRHALIDRQKKMVKNLLQFKNPNESSSNRYDILIKKKKINTKNNNHHSLNREKRNNINNNYSNSVNNYSLHYKRRIISSKSKNKNNLTQNKIEKKDENTLSINNDGNKREEDESRKFSINDIPSLNQIQEKTKEILKEEIKENKEQCIYLCTKSNIVPFKIRIKLSMINKKIYKLNSPNKILSDYINFLENEIKGIKIKLKENLIPSLTVQSELNFINLNDENDFYNYNSDDDIIIQFLKCLLILFNYNKDIKNIKCEEVIKKIKEISNGNIRNYLLNEERMKNINDLSLEKINKFIELFSGIKNEIKNKKLPVLLYKLNFFIEEIYEFLIEKSKYKKKYLDKSDELNKLKQNQFLSKME